MVYIIGVAGGTASGKTSTCHIIRNKLGVNIEIISMDSFYLPLPNDQDVSKTNFDNPLSFDWDLFLSTLKQIKEGSELDIPIYDFVTHQRTDVYTIRDYKCVIVEGILSLYDSHIRDLFDIKLFVDTPSDIRLIRRIRRDIEERGRTLESVLQQYESTVIPSHDQFIEPTKKYADLIIPRGKTNLAAISVIVTMIKKHV